MFEENKLPQIIEKAKVLKDTVKEVAKEDLDKISKIFKDKR